MLLGIIADIHSNLIALNQVLTYLDGRGVDRIFCLGDIVGYGPSPNECVDLIRSKCSAVVAGNHDCALAGTVSFDRFDKPGRKALKWTSNILTVEHKAYLAGLPLKTAEQNLTLAHASPANPEQWRYILSPADAREAFTAFSTPVCFVGHTHIPVVIGEDLSVSPFRKDGRFVINVGSVGQPRDGDPRASFGLFNTAERSYELVRLEYNVQETADAIAKAGLPAILAKRLFSGY